jgi:hypothetical protein
LVAITTEQGFPAWHAQGTVYRGYAKVKNGDVVKGISRAESGSPDAASAISSCLAAGGITDEIMAQIKRSRFVVSDYTSQRNSVYFEAGFALGLGVIVIPTCRADEIPNLHFDIRHLNTLPWNTPAELADGLNRRIRAVVGAGPDDPDPS